jgi:hypothetical protein
MIAKVTRYRQKIRPIDHMHKHETHKTRITLERVTVTTVRRGQNPAPVYCDICKKLIGPEVERKLLEAVNDADDDLRDENKK